MLDLIAASMIGNYFPGATIEDAVPFCLLQIGNVLFWTFVFKFSNR